jgi:hypothetical protein
MMSQHSLASGEDYRSRFEGREDGPTGGILRDLPSPYVPHACGLLHLPRFMAKIRKHLAGQLPASYQRNFTKGFDRFLCLHLRWEPQEVVEWVRANPDPVALEQVIVSKLPADLKVHEWNRKVAQMGMSEMGREKLQEVKTEMGLSGREDLISFADLIDFDEGRIA